MSYFTHMLSHLDEKRLPPAGPYLYVLAGCCDMFNRTGFQPSPLAAFHGDEARSMASVSWKHFHPPETMAGLEPSSLTIAPASWHRSHHGSGSGIGLTPTDLIDTHTTISSGCKPVITVAGKFLASETLTNLEFPPPLSSSALPSARHWFIQ